MSPLSGVESGSNFSLLIISASFVVSEQLELAVAAISICIEVPTARVILLKSQTPVLLSYVVEAGMVELVASYVNSAGNKSRKVIPAVLNGPEFNMVIVNVTISFISGVALSTVLVMLRSD